MLTDTGRLPNDRLKASLDLCEYFSCLITPGIWDHNTKFISLTLFVDDFDIKYTNKQDVENLHKALSNNYETLTTGWYGSLYKDMPMNWAYTNKNFHLLIPGYIKKVLM